VHKRGAAALLAVDGKKHAEILMTITLARPFCGFVAWHFEPETALSFVA
jgi:hypothetical protein